MYIWGRTGLGDRDANAVAVRTGWKAKTASGFAACPPISTTTGT